MDKIGKLEEAISHFPTIKQFIGIDRILNLAQKDSVSPLVYYLERSLYDEDKVKQLMSDFRKNPRHVGVLIILDYYLNYYWTMKHLDHCLSEIKDCPKIDVFIRHLLDSNSFWQGYCEVEVAANVKQTFGKVELEPLMPNGKSVDVKFYLNSDEVFVEVSAPKTGDLYRKALEKATGRVVKLPDVKQRAVDRLLDELEHFKGILDEIKSVIVLNLNESDFDDLEIEDILSGIELRLLVEKSAKNLSASPTIMRNGWTLFESEPDLRKVGAVICYKRNFDILSGNIIYTKRIFAISFESKETTELSMLFQ